ncbi:MAG: cytidine deaminase [Bacteroidetes bacterium]|nr:cytidine deaminase [Bacteroidota bacterium]MDA1267676.1 cytidine deaminase [Bacteroidota bacterium]
MKKIVDTIEIEELTLSELNPQEATLLQRAQEISKNAYAPYSKFQVGAAVSLSNGKIYQSSNQENVSFPVGTCAERLLLGYVGANFPEQAPQTLAIVARREGEIDWAGVSPCGMCRQTINETENRYQSPITILLLQPKGIVLRFQGIRHLLPLKFDDLHS